MLSATDAIQRAMDWTRKILFTPFDLGKWCVMGFTAFLAGLLSGGGSGYNGNHAFKGFGQVHEPHSAAFLDPFLEVRSWVLLHLPLVTLLGTLLLALVLVLRWLSCRGEFMFLDNVVKDRAQVSEPWRRFRTPANRVFAFRVVLGIVLLAVVALGTWMGWRIAGPDLLAEELGLRFFQGLLAFCAVVLPVGFVVLMVKLVLQDFVVPVMYIRNCPVGEAFGIVWGELICGRLGSFVLFYLLKFLLFLVAAVIMVLGSCLTCCVAAIPYVSSVVFLPILVFFRAYSLEFLGQIAPEWRLLAERAHS
jgi:hypothetical protein